jgi:deazaflavin-dependent oxidoreductase (nitroreductase family)
MGAMSRLQVRLYHRMGDRMWVQGQPVLLLSTMGAKTGKLRQAVLCWFPDSDASDSDQSWLIVASGAGSLKHPAWFVNLARNPNQVSIEMGGRQIEVQPQSLRGEERADAWKRITALAPGYAAYETRTDRVIPIIRLQAMA